MINLFILGIGVRFISQNDEVCRRIQKDFESFLVSEDSAQDLYCVYGKIDDPYLEPVVNSRPTMNRSGVRSYREAEKIINLYEHGAYSIFDSKKREVWIHSSKIDLLHEITFLVINSIVGKALDRRGIHRIHGMCLGIGSRVAIGIGDSGVGKSTLFLNALLKRNDLYALADDVTIFAPPRQIYPFPTRIGIPEILTHKFEADELTTMQRRKYGEKHLLSFKRFKYVVPPDDSKISLVFIRRSNNGTASIRSVCRISAYPLLFKNMVVGVGLPMVLEYFIEWKVQDFYILTKIAIKRLMASLWLMNRSVCYELSLGRDHEENTEQFLKALE